MDEGDLQLGAGPCHRAGGVGIDHGGGSFLILGAVDGRPGGGIDDGGGPGRQDRAGASRRIAQIGLITAFPLWSILLIVLYVLVIWNLTVYGLTTSDA